MALISLRGLTKSYGDRQVLHGVDLDVDQGQILGVAGPNGAGKTTMVDCLSSQRCQVGGTISCDGNGPARCTTELRRLRSFQLQQSVWIRVLRTYEVY